LVSVINWRREILGRRRGETVERNLSWLEWSVPSALSNDGENLLITEQGTGAGTRYGIYLRKMDDSPAIRLGEGMGLGFSPDGKWALAIAETTPARIALLPVGPGDARMIQMEDLTAQFGGGWLPNGKSFLLLASRPGHGIQLFVQDLAGGAPRAVTPEGGEATYGAAVSPDGKYVCVVGADRRLGLYPLAGGEPRIVGEPEARESPVQWSSDGRYLFVARLGESPARVDRLELATGRREPWKEFQPADSSGVLDVGPILISPDGESYAYSFRRMLSDLYLVTGLR
jgi:Tol biopolymer transport system component